MRFVSTLAALVVAAAGLALAGSAVAQQDVGDDLVPKRIERAERVVKALEEAEKRAKATEPVDLSYVELIAEALEDARALTKPATLAELTDEEKEGLAEEIRETDGEGGGDGLNEWQKRALVRALEGTGISEEEEAEVRPILEDWFTESWNARMERDSKKQSDLKKERDAALTKALGRKKARKLINNLNSWGGRGGGR
jgi:hypothetical protein